MSYSAEEIGVAISRILSKYIKIEAALLMGSCSRNEETYFMNINGEYELLSDYEMLIIVKDSSALGCSDEELRQLSTELKEASSSPCFDLDWSYKTISEIKRLDKRFIFFEAKECAKVIYGNSDVLDLFPQINIKNLNYSELNTVIIHRLYHVLKYSEINDEKYQKYLIARNTLDIPTAALPLMGILASTYVKRNKIFAAKADRRYFSDSFIKRLSDYFYMKRDYDSILYEKYDLLEMRKMFVEDFQQLHLFQNEKQKGNSFKRDSRMLFSAVYRRNIALFEAWRTWPQKNEALCADMYDALMNKRKYFKRIERIRSEMKDKFGYQ